MRDSPRPASRSASAGPGVGLQGVEQEQRTHREHDDRDPERLLRLLDGGRAQRDEHAEPRHEKRREDREHDGDDESLRTEQDRCALAMSDVHRNEANQQVRDREAEAIEHRRDDLANEDRGIRQSARQQRLERVAFAFASDGIRDERRYHCRGEERPVPDDDLRLHPFRPELNGGDDAEDQREDERREPAAPEREELVAELTPLLPHHGPDIAHHPSAPLLAREPPLPDSPFAVGSAPMRSRNASSSVARARRTSSISTA